MARLLKTWRRPSHEPPSVEREFSWEREEVEKRQRGGDLFCFKDVWFTCKLVTCIQRKSHTLMIPIQRYCFFFPTEHQKKLETRPTHKRKNGWSRRSRPENVFFLKAGGCSLCFPEMQRASFNKNLSHFVKRSGSWWACKGIFWTIDIISEISNIISWICKPMNSFKCFQSNM